MTESVVRVSGGLTTAVLVVARHETQFTLSTSGNLTVVRAEAGLAALALARETRPSVIIIDYTLADASGPEVCRQLRRESVIGRGVPILFLSEGRPTPEQRVAALHCGAWEFIWLPADEHEVTLKVQLYAEAKRHFDMAIASQQLESASGLRTSVDLARQAHQLGALMSRLHAGLACVVFDVAGDLPATGVAMAVARTARSSDVVGMLSHGRFGIVAPATDRQGAVNLAMRVASVARQYLEQEPGGAGEAARLLAGFDAVSNVRYAPVDPVDLIRNASFAVRFGSLEPGSLWLRSSDDSSRYGSPTEHEMPLRSSR